MGESKPQILNMTSLETRKNILTDSAVVTDNVDHLIVGAPVHSGKIPVQVIECLKQLNGNGKECSAIVVYGNRDYGIALHAMVKLLSEAGFKIASAAAFIGQHTYSDIVPVAVGRPDRSDMKVAQLFGFMSLNVTEVLNLDDIPIQLDKYSKSNRYTSLKPNYNKNLCKQCGRCSALCPLSLIAPDNGSYLHPSSKKRCIGCMACVKGCKQSARELKVNPLVKIVMNRLLKQAAVRWQEPITIFKENSRTKLN